MTKFLDYYNIFPIPDPKEFLGISPDREEGRVITTLGKSFIVILDVSNNKQRHSWTTTEKLSTKVVYDRCTEKYVGGFANRLLRCWDDNTPDINKCKKLKFQRRIHDLITNDEGFAFVVYVDGSMEPLNVALQTRKDKPETVENELSQPYTLSQSKILRLANGGQVYTYFKRCNRSDQLFLVSYLLTEEGVIIPNSCKEHLISQGNSEIKAAGFAVIEAEHSLFLLTIWSDKRIFMLDILDKNSTKLAPGKYVSMLSELDVSNPFNVAGISKNFIVIYGATTNKDGAFLLLYNTQYKIIKAKQYFKLYFDIARFWVMKEHILLGLGPNLSAIKYRISKALLAELIGTQISNTYDTYVEEEQLNDVEDFDENLNLVKSEVKDSSLVHTGVGSAKDSFLAQNCGNVNVSIADGRTIPFQPYEDFEAKINNLRQVLLHVDIVESNSETPKIDVVSNLFDHEFTHPLILSLVQHMELCGASEQEISEKVISVLIKTDRKKDILACLSRYGNHSEKTLVKCLGYVLTNCTDILDDIFQAKDIVLNTEPSTEEATNQSLEKSKKTLGKRRRTLSKGSMNSNGCSPGKDKSNRTRTSSNNHNSSSIDNKLNYKFLDYVLEKEIHIHTIEKQNLEKLPLEIKLLNKILSHHFQPERLSAYIRAEISYENMIKSLNYLFILLQCKDVFQFELFPKFQPSGSDFELQIFRWFGSLINAHFQQMILSKDKPLLKILKRWGKVFSLYKLEAKQLQETAAILYKIVQKSKSPSDRNYVKWYSIEEVDIF